MTATLMTEFTSAGPKNYGYKTHQGKVCCKVKGFALNCLISRREGLGTSLQIMGLATIDPHSHEVQTKLYRIPKFGVNQASFN